MLLICKTSVQRKSDVVKLAPLLNKLTEGGGQWNFDLEDCDRVLRIDIYSLDIEKLVLMLRQEGFYCAELEG